MAETFAQDVCAASYRVDSLLRAAYWNVLFPRPEVLKRGLFAWSVTLREDVPRVGEEERWPGPPVVFTAVAVVEEAEVGVVDEEGDADDARDREVPR